MALSVDTQRALANALGSQAAANELLGALTVTAEAVANIDLEPAPNPSDSPVDADALRDDLVTNTIFTINARFSEVELKFNDLLQSLRNAGILGA